MTSAYSAIRVLPAATYPGDGSCQQTGRQQVGSQGMATSFFYRTLSYRHLSDTRDEIHIAIRTRLSCATLAEDLVHDRCALGKRLPDFVTVDRFGGGRAVVADEQGDALHRDVVRG
jgi:hypothetical protein